MKSYLGLLSFLLCLCYGQNLFAQPTADFGANVTSGCEFLVVDFTNNSGCAGCTIDTWSWSFGTSGSASNMDPSFTFVNVGSYEICLTVTATDGSSDTKCIDDYIVIHSNPVASYNAAPLAGCPPLTTTFNDTSTPGDGDIVSWVWSLGGSAGILTDDGSAPDITSTYTISDIYNTNLTVIDEFGCTNTTSSPIQVDVYEVPEIDFDVDQNTACAPPLTVNFSNNGSTNNVTYEWDFGSGGTYSGPNPDPVTFSSNGTYTVTVTATNTVTGCVNTEVFPAFISIGQGSLFGLSRDTVCLGEPITFFDVSSTPANSVSWDFGDSQSSTFPTISHTYAAVGCYTVELTRNLNGCSVTAERLVCVLPYPTADFTASDTISCELPFVVDFNSNATGDGLEYLWEFDVHGVTLTSTEENPQMEFFTYGTFPVKLTVTNAAGCQATATEEIKTFELKANLPILSILGCPPLSVVVFEESETCQPDSWITNWEWEVIPGGYTSSDPVPTFVITDVGSYDIQLIITNNLGCKDTTIAYDVIQIGTPTTPIFSATPMDACANEEIQFTNLSMPEGEVWVWDFGDGSTPSLEENPIHLYRDTGCFDVTFNLFFNGCNSELVAEDAVCIEGPIAAFDDLTDCTNPLEFIVNNTSIGADNVFWDFGDPNSTTDVSTDWNPTYTYTDEGQYTVTLIATSNTSACSDTIEYDLSVSTSGSGITIDPMGGCAPIEVLVTAPNAGSGATYEWISPTGLIQDDDDQSTLIFYDNPGNHELTLKISGGSGCVDSTTIIVPAGEITADFTVTPGIGCIPLNVTLMDNSNNLYGNNINVQWIIGDTIGMASGDNATFLVDTLGSFPVTMIVEDDLGCKDSVTLTNQIQVMGPLPAFSILDTAGCVQDMYSFENESIGAGLTYVWDFGDGGSSTDEDPTHIYTLPGEYTVCLTVTDINMCDSTLCYPNVIEVGDPSAQFMFDANFIECPPLIVTFDNTSSQAIDYLWDFGDNSGVSQEVDPSHLYTIPGVYDVTLVAHANANCRDTFVYQDLVIVEGPQGDFDFGVDTVVCGPNANIEFNATSTQNVNYTWDFGDGVITQGAQGTTSDVVAHTYANAGYYVPILTLEDEFGCAVPYIAGTALTVLELNTNFTASTNVICNNELVQFNNTSTFFDTFPATTFLWNFENGNPPTSTDENPLVDFTTIGMADVQLIASNGVCTDTLELLDFIDVGESPVADFDQSANLGCVPFTVSFTDQSTIGNGTIASWEWDFGDGETSTDPSPNHNYTSVQDSFVIELIVQSMNGCSDTVSSVVYVQDALSITTTPDLSICLGDTIDLSAQILNDTTGFTWNWSSADPSLSCTDCFDAIAIPTQNEIYTFNVQTPTGCNAMSDVEVTISPNSITAVGLPNDTTLCLGDTYQIIATGGIADSSYVWDASVPGLDCYTNCSDPIVNPLVTSTYAVTVTNEDCSADGDITITVVNEAQPFIIEDSQTICQGESVDLNINFGSNPTWIVTDGLTCTACATTSASPMVPTMYIAEVTTPSGCLIRDSVFVDVILQSSISAGPDKAICVNESVILDGFGQGNVTWTPSASLDADNIFMPEAFPTVTTEYIMSVNAGNCVLRDTVLITVLEKSEIEVMDQILCLGDSVVLEATGFATNFEWSPAEGLSATDIAAPTASPTETTMYTVIASLGSCEADTVDVLVTVEPPFTIATGAVQGVLPGQTISLDVQTMPATGNFTYQWTPSTGLSCDNCANPSITPIGDVNFLVTITNTESGCIVSKNIFVDLVDDCGSEFIGMPNAFSPNDDGINDVLKVESKIVNEIKIFQVFNRWGDLVFTTNDINVGWDGFWDGEAVGDGVYTFYVEAVCIFDGSILIKKGDVTVIR